MAHLYKKVKKGREYYYIRETQRIYGKPTTINQVYLGTSDKVNALMEGDELEVQRSFSPKEFGSVFFMHELDQVLNLSGIADAVLPPKRRTKGPSLGDLLFYAVVNRAISPRSKRQLANWFNTTDIQRIRPGRLEALSSQNFWNHWDRLDDASLDKISRAFFRNVRNLLPPRSQHLVMEITNFYASPGSTSPYREGGHGEPGHRSPRRIGLALITERSSGTPVHYHMFPGNLPEGEYFQKHLDEILAKIAAIGINVKDFTFIFNHGISEDVINRIDSQQEFHFIASYPASFSAELAAIPLDKFQPLPCKINRRLIQSGEESEQVLYYETHAELWGRPRKVVVTFDPKAFQKKLWDLQEQIYKVKRQLVDWQEKQRLSEAPGDPPLALQTRYQDICRQIGLEPRVIGPVWPPVGAPAALFGEVSEERLTEIARDYAKTILITDHEDWVVTEICQAYIDRCMAESHLQDRHSALRETLMPQYHWTNSKIRIHIFVCVAALTYLALLNKKLHDAGLLTTPKEAMEVLRSVDSAIRWVPQEGKFRRVVEPPNPTQKAVLEALGYQVQEGKIISPQA